MILGINQLTAKAGDMVNWTGRVASTPVKTSTPLQIGRHTSELQSQAYLVCRLLLEKKNNNTKDSQTHHLIR